MIPALTIEEIQDKSTRRYGEGEKKIVIIMLARYSIEAVQKSIINHYAHWNNYTEDIVDYYWLGYGAYIFPRKPSQILVGNFGDQSNVFFDGSVFVQEIRKLEELSNLPYKDTFGMLLCNYYDNRIHFDERNRVYFDLESYTIDGDKPLRDFSNHLIKFCQRNDNISEAVSFTRGLY